MTLLAPTPRLHHIAGMALWAGSWLTLLGLIVASTFGIWDPRGDTVDVLFGVPVLFRLAGSVLVLVRGTPLAIAALLVDLWLMVVIVADVSGDTKGRLLLTSLLLANLIPAVWSGLRKRLGALFGAVGTVFSVLSWLGMWTNVDEDILLPLVAFAVLFSWAADGAVAYWALRHWRDENLDEERGLS